MKAKDIKEMRLNLGKFLHDYYLKFGEEKYDEFLKKLEPTLVAEYGEPFSSENMRIMEAEFVTLTAFLKEKKNCEKDTKIVE